MACSLAPAYFHHCRSSASICWSRLPSGDSGLVPAETDAAVERCSCACSATTHSLAGSGEKSSPMLRANNRVVICHPARMGPVHTSDPPDSDAVFELEPSRADAVGFAELALRPLPELVAPDWAEALVPVERQLRDVLAFLGREVAEG